MLIVEIRNLGTHPQRPEFGHYEYTVKVNDKVIARGGVRDHRRTHGWRALLNELLDADLAAILGDRSSIQEPPLHNASASQPHSRRRPRLPTR